MMLTLPGPVSIAGPTQTSYAVFPPAGLHGTFLAPPSRKGRIMLTLRRFSMCAITALILFLGGHLVYAVTLGAPKADGSADAFVEYVQVWREQGEVEALKEKNAA